MFINWEGIAYWIALLTIATMPVALIWFVIHPFIIFWRKRGALLAYLTSALIVIPIFTLVLVFRDNVMAVHYEFNWLLISLGALSLVIGMTIGMKRVNLLTPKIMFGIPELSSKSKGKLITSGIYSKIRHPRYAEVFLMVFGLALMTNYLSMYLLSVAMLVLLYLVVLLEENELKHRFGNEYTDYCKKVPRFIPRR
jgi:protein-S-isoprenylcysteine O-methyltransferase Ste14